MINVGYGVTLLSRCLNQGGIDGIGSYSRELFNALQQFDTINLSAVSFGEGIPVQITEISHNTIELPAFSRQALISLASGLPFPGCARLQIDASIDIFHATDHRIPKLRKVPVIATLMDALPLSHPEWVGSGLARLKFKLWQKSAHWADHVLTISEYSKHQIIEHFKVPAEKVSVVPLGVSKKWFERADPVLCTSIRARYKLPPNFFLAVGTLQPRKNIERLVDAHLLLPDQTRQEVPLVIVGREGWMCDDLVKKLESGVYNRTIIWLKHLPDEDLRVTVQLASALVFISLGEGFGLPVLEAFAAGTPVITSNTTSLPEVADDAAILVDPHNREEIADAMVRILADSSLANSLQTKGLERAKLFTWQNTAKGTIKSYHHVLGH